MEEQAEITLAPSLKRYRTRNGGGRTAWRLPPHALREEARPELED